MVKIKEIVYLDTAITNSLLSQLNSGLVTKMINGLDEIETNSRYSTVQETHSIGVGMSAVINANGNFSKVESEQNGFVFSSNNKQLLETALDDFSLDVLIDNLNENSVLNIGKEEGNFILEEGELSIYNFNKLSESSNLDILGDILPGYYKYKSKKEELDRLKREENGDNISEIQKLEEEINNVSWNNFYLIHIFSSYLSKIWPTSSVVKLKDNVAICSNNNFKLSLEQLVFNSFSKRKCKILGIITGKVEQNPLDYLGIEPNSSKIFNSGTDVIMYIALNEQGVLNIGDYIVRPIAIYFEN